MKKYVLFLFLLPILAIGQTTQTFSTAGTSSFVVPNGVTSLDVQAWGAGGGGGGTSNTLGVGAGGGGGGNYIKNTVSVTPGATYLISVGAGGSGGPSNGNAFNGGISAIQLSGSNNFPILAALGGTGGGGAINAYKSGAAGINNASSNAITYSLTNVGAGYASAPTVTIAPSGGYKTYAISTAYALNDIVSSGINFYTVTTGGTTSASLTTLLANSAFPVTNGSATFTYRGVMPTATATLSGGYVSYLTINQNSGFTGTPLITFSGGTPTTAATATTALITSASYSPTAPNNNIGGSGAAGLNNTYSGGGGGSAGTTNNGTNASTSTAGAGGAVGGGAGASGSINITAAGIAATNLGGGGGGADNNSASGGVANAGGAGFRGQVTINYTCTTYSLTAAASATPFTSGGSSTLTLTSSSLPAGTYTVTYSTTNPVTSGNTATMIFSGTTGTFSTMALTATSDITVNTLQSGSGLGCSSTVTTNNTATAVLVVVTAGAIAVNQTICNASTPAALTSATDGTVSSGTLSYEWQTNASGSFVTIASATASTYAPPSLAATTSYQRRTLSVSGGTTLYSAYTSAVVVTVNNVTAVGTIGITTNTICNGNTATISSSTAGAGSGTITYEWQTNETGNYFTIPSATLPTYTTPALTTTTSYQRRAVSTLNGVVCYSAYTSPLTITVSDVLTTGSIGSAQTYCAGSLVIPSTFASLTAGTGSGIITYQWYSSTDTFVSVLATTADYTPTTPITATTTYRRRTVSTFNTRVCFSGYVNAVVTFNTMTEGVIGGAATICSGNDRIISQLAPGTATTGVIGRTYEWQSNDGAGWVTMPGEINTNYQTPILTTTTSYQRRTVAVSNSLTCYSDYTTPVTIYVNSVDKGKIGTKQSICAGDTPAPLTSIIDGTGAGTFTYEWQVRVGIPGPPLNPTYTNIPGATMPTYSPGVKTLQTSYRRRVVSTLNGLTCVSEFDALGIKVNEPEEGIIGADQTICSGTTPATLSSIEDGQAPGTITYEWQANDGTGYITIPSAILATYTPPALTVTTSYQRRTTGQCAGLPTYSVWTTAVTITVNVVTAGTIGTNQTYCTAATPVTLTSTLAGTGAGTITYEWQTNASGSYVTIPVATALTYSPPLLTATTSYQRRTIATLNGVSCYSVYTTPITITIDSNPVAPTITAITNATCKPFTGTVTLSGLPATGTWTINPGGITGTGTSNTVTGLSSGTYTFTVTNSNGCISIASSTATIASAVLNTWNGTTWSNDTPNNQQSLIFNADYPPTIDPNVDLYGCSCTVTTGNNVTIKVGRSLIITDQVTVVGTGTLTFENTASLVQVNNVTNSGNINYIRKTTPINKFDYTYWSTPVLPFNLGGISPNTLGDKYYSFDSSINNWKQESIATSMVPGKGYIIRGPQSFNDTARSAYVAVFNGVPINGTVSISGIVPNAPCLLGNPYPSALDADSFLNTNQNVLEGTLYFWTHNTPIAVGTPNPGTGYFAYSGDDYATYNQTGGTATAPSSTTGGFNTNIPCGIIASCQGFFGRTKTVAAGFASSTPIVYTNAMRVGVGGISGDNTQFFRTKVPATKSATVVEKHRVWLNLTNEQGAFKQTLVGYITGANNAYESRFDGKSIDGNEFLDFYSINQDKNLTIQGRALPFDENDEVILGYRCAINGDFTINIDQVDGLLTNQSVFIEDKLTNSITDLKASNYSFKTTKGTFNDRFVLRYKYKTLGTNDLLAESNVVLVSVKDKQIKIDSFAETIDEVTIYDLLGRKIYQKDKVSSDELLVMNFVSSCQILIVKTTLQNGTTVTNKIFIR